MAYSQAAVKNSFAPRCRGPWAKVTMHGGAVVYVDPLITEAVLALNVIAKHWDYRASGYDNAGYGCRQVAGTNRWSKHAYGIAIDREWVRNPHRRPLTTDRPAAMCRAINAVRTNNGAQVWYWGGYWSKPDCFTGDTEIITRDGQVPIRLLAGSEVELLSTTADPTETGEAISEWVKAPVRSFGWDETFEVTLSRQGLRRSIRTTRHHRWPVQAKDGTVRFVTTEDLVSAWRQGDGLFAMRNPEVDPVDLDSRAVAQGIVWGDGSVYNTHGNRVPRSSVRLYGAKRELAARVAAFAGAAGPTDDGHDGLRFSKMDPGLKSLPDVDASTEVLAGFFAGWFATDGHVDPKVPPSLSTSDVDAVRFIHEVAPRLGLTITSVHVQSAGKSGFGSTLDNHQILFRDIPEWLLVRPDQRDAHPDRDRRWFRWKLEGVRPTGIHEEVFCPTVEGRNVVAVAAGDLNVLSGNSMHDEVVCFPSHLSSGINWSTVAGFVQPAPQPKTASDWAAIRRLAAASVIDGVRSAPNMGPGHTGPGPFGADLHVAAIQKALNVATGTKLKENGVYDAWTEGVIKNFQNFVTKVIRGPMPDPHGHFREYTRFYLVAALQNIIDGKA